MIRGIVFDLDGTLIDTARILADSWEAAFSSEGKEIGYNELYNNTKGISSKDIVKKYLPKSVDSDISRLKKKRGEKFIELMKKGDSLLYPETKEVLVKLNEKGIKIAIGTGMSFDLLDRVLDVTGLSKLVAAVVSSDDVNEGKPAPDIFIEAFKRLNVIPQEGMVVGDSINDILPGKKIGAFTVFISRDKQKLDIADKSISDLREIFSFI